MRYFNTNHGYTRTLIFIALSFSAFLFLAINPVPTTINDFFFPGSQPGQSGNLEHPDKCDNCHGGYDINVEPAFNWRGSMMAQAMRDPLFEACLAISNQDAPDAGDLCLRCHTPDGWLNGRSIPTDGSALNNNDMEGVQCDFCHKLIKPTELGVNPFPDNPDYTQNTYQLDQDYLATLEVIPPQSGNGAYIADASNAKRGPYVDAPARHKMNYSPFHKEASLCGTCHDVSNPAYDRQPDNTYIPNAFDARATDFNTYAMFPIERTYSEWLQSDYNTSEGIYAPQFGGNKSNVSTCQDCHMRDVTGYGCNKKGAPLRHDLPLHDMTGGNTFIPGLVAQLFPEDIDQAALDAGVQRATDMLQKAASFDLDVTETVDGFLANVRVTNETGHKLPSGYPEGRRIWINLKALDEQNNIVYESGAYDFNTAELIHDPSAKIYEIKPGLSADIAALVGNGELEAGPSFHFVLNNEIFSDNRIPPRGFTNANFEMIQSPPVNYAYADGQYWDESTYDLPPSSAKVMAVLYYQTLSKEYVTFLKDENITNEAGNVLYSLWDQHGKSAPVIMNAAEVNLVSPVAGFSGDKTSGTRPLTVNFTDESSGSPVSWLWDFGDGNVSTASNPTHIYNSEGTYTVSLTVSNGFSEDTEIKANYITVSSPVETLIYVNNISVSRIKAKGGRAYADAVIEVFDEGGNPVGEVEVTTLFSGPSEGIATGRTDILGLATLSSKAVKNPVGEWCFTVNDLALTGYIYDAGLNSQTSACENENANQSARIMNDVITENDPSIAYPNPFNHRTSIGFRVDKPEKILVQIFNMDGRLVDLLVDKDLEKGYYTYSWDASSFPSGYYFYRINSNSLSEIQKIYKR